MMFFLLICWFGSFMALIGTLLNTWKQQECFIFWLVSNSIMVFQSYSTESWNMVLLFMVYLGLAVYGLYHWRKSDEDMIRISSLPAKIQAEIQELQEEF